jgi:hypothetical protein
MHVAGQLSTIFGGMWMKGTLMYKNSFRFQKWSKLLGKDSREHEEARDARIDRSSGRKGGPTTPDEEFRRTFEKLRVAAGFLGEKLDEMAGEFGWQGCVRRASEILSRWSHLSDEESEPRPNYDDYLTAHGAYDELAGVTAFPFDPEVRVTVALFELRGLREKYGECQADHSQQDTERRAEKLLADWEQIKQQIEDAKHHLEHLIFEVPAFDTHKDRYYDDTEDGW